MLTVLILLALEFVRRTFCFKLFIANSKDIMMKNENLVNRREFTLPLPLFQSMEPLKLEELKSEKCPRISAEDLLELGEFGGNTTTRSPTKKRVNTKPMLLVIDVRTPEEYP